MASVYLRQPASLSSGVLELRREAFVGRVNTGDAGSGFDCEALRIGGAGSSLSEEEIACERLLSLPDSECLVFPLAAGQFLVREGTGWKGRGMDQVPMQPSAPPISPV